MSNPVLESAKNVIKNLEKENVDMRETIALGYFQPGYMQNLKTYIASNERSIDNLKAEYGIE